MEGNGKDEGILRLQGEAWKRRGRECNCRNGSFRNRPGS